MKRRYYKVKNKTTEQYWTGYGSKFTDGGAEFTSPEQVGYELRIAVRYHHKSLQNILDDLEVEEFEVSVASSGVLDDALYYIVQSERDSVLVTRYGKSFIRNYLKLNKDENFKPKFAIRIDPANFSKFKETLKGMGYSSRYYKKTDNWIWTDNDDVVVNTKLIGGYEEIVNLMDIEKGFQERVAEVRTKGYKLPGAK